ncbi:MAG: hypothetical protein OXC40_05165, partial [Proteobacteria bacterium]|nr:hypothetical protein [Pseudomonadota bacterium]
LCGLILLNLCEYDKLLVWCRERSKFWVRTRYTEELQFLMTRGDFASEITAHHQQQTAMNFFQESRNASSGYFAVTLHTYGLAPQSDEHKESHDQFPLDYCVLRSLLRFVSEDRSKSGMAKKILKQLDAQFGFTLAKGLYELNQAYMNKSSTKISQKIKQLRARFPDHQDVAKMSEMLTAVIETNDNKASTRQHGFQYYVASFKQALANDDIHSALSYFSMATQSYLHSDELDTVAVSVKVTPGDYLTRLWQGFLTTFAFDQADSLSDQFSTSKSQRKRVWLCFLADRSYSEYFTKQSFGKQQHLILAMDDQVAKDDHVLMMKTCEKGSKLLGIYQVFFASPFTLHTEKNKLLVPLLNFNDQQYPSVYLDTHDLDVSEKIDTQKRFGFEESVNVSGDSLAVILAEIKKQAQVSHEDYEKLQHRWQKLA